MARSEAAKKAAGTKKEINYSVAPGRSGMLSPSHSPSPFSSLVLLHESLSKEHEDKKGTSTDYDAFIQVAVSEKRQRSDS